jgi:hypothetical protein
LLVSAAGRFGPSGGLIHRRSVLPFQRGVGQPSVDQGGVQVLMAHQTPQPLDPHAVVQQHRGVGVPQTVGGEVRDAHRVAQTVQMPPRLAGLQGASSPTEQEITGGVRHRLQVLPQHLSRLGGQVHHPVSAPLPLAYSHPPARQVQVLHLQVQGLADPQPSVPQQVVQRHLEPTIGPPFLPTPLQPPLQGQHLARFQVAGQGIGQLQGGSIGQAGQSSPILEVAQQLVDPVQPGLDRLGGQALAQLGIGEGGDVCGGQLFEAGQGTPAQLPGPEEPQFQQPVLGVVAPLAGLPAGPLVMQPRQAPLPKPVRCPTEPVLARATARTSAGDRSRPRLDPKGRRGLGLDRHGRASQVQLHGRLVSAAHRWVCPVDVPLSGLEAAMAQQLGQAEHRQPALGHPAPVGVAKAMGGELDPTEPSVVAQPFLDPCHRDRPSQPIAEDGLSRTGRGALRQVARQGVVALPTQVDHALLAPLAHHSQAHWASVPLVCREVRRAQAGHLAHPQPRVQHQRHHGQVPRLPDHGQQPRHFAVGEVPRQELRLATGVTAHGDRVGLARPAQLVGDEVKEALQRGNAALHGGGCQAQIVLSIHEGVHVPSAHLVQQARMELGKESQVAHVVLGGRPIMEASLQMRLEARHPLGVRSIIHVGLLGAINSTPQANSM